MALKIFVVILGEIALRGGNAPLEAAFVRLHLAHQDLEQRGHGQLIVRDKGDLVPAAHNEGHIVQHLLAVNGLGDAAHLQNILARLAVLLERDPRIPARGRRQFLNGQLVDQLAAAGRLARLGLVCRKALDEVLQLLDFFLIFAVLVLDHALNELRGLVPELIVADIQLDLAVVDVHDMGAHVVEEVAVMRDDQHGALKIRQEILKPAHCLDIQMVGRLVEQQDIRLAEQRAGEQNLNLFHVAKVFHLGIQDCVRVQTQAVEQLPCLGLSLPAAHLGKLCLEFGGAVAVLLGKRVLHVERVLFLHDFKQARVAAEHGIKHGLVVKRKVILLENAHARLGRDRHRAGRGV